MIFPEITNFELDREDIQEFSKIMIRRFLLKWRIDSKTENPPYL